MWYIKFIYFPNSFSPSSVALAKIAINRFSIFDLPIATKDILRLYEFE